MGRLAAALICLLALSALCGCALGPPPPTAQGGVDPGVGSAPGAPSPTATAPVTVPAPTPAVPALPPATDPASTAWATQVPASTRQVIRTITSRRWCAKPHCTLTQAWERSAQGWQLLRQFRSSIGPKGWGKRRQDDGRSPEGVFRVKVTFSTTQHAPGRMPWRRRLPTSNVTDDPGARYNTWVEESGRTNGDRPAMRWGLVVDYNNVRLQPGAGPAPVPLAGSGIFYHTSSPGHRWSPSEGCTQVGDPNAMRWLLTWLRPDAQPRIVQNR